MSVPCVQFEGTYGYLVLVLHERGVQSSCVICLYSALSTIILHCTITIIILSRSQLKAKFFDFLDENRRIFVVLSGRLERDFGVLF